MRETSSGMNRRQFIYSAGMAAIAAAFPFMIQGEAWGAPMSAPVTPYDENALEPYISARTFSFHFGKHHLGYFNKLGAQIKGTGLEGLSLVEIIKRTCGDEKMQGVFNNAAQVWNHTFYWMSLSPGKQGPKGALAQKIDQGFGGVEGFKKEFAKAAGSRFGSGWAWLVLNKEGELAIMATGNADTPLCMGLRPLFTLDVWEHAYYLDYQNRRGDYIKAVLDNLVNWDFVQANLAGA